MKQISAWLICSLIFASSVYAEPGDNLETIDLEPFNSRTNSSWGEVLKDIVNHEAPGDSNNYSDKITLGHETSHGIHSYIRNRLNDTGARANGFYLLNNRAALVKEPNMRKRHVTPFVPNSLRGSRFNLYIVGSTSWDDTPLYIWDEWNAYINGAVAGVDLVNNDMWNGGWRDGVAGVIEFVVYALATAMAAEQHDPDYLNNYHQFKELLAFNVKRSMTVFLEGRELEVFKWEKQDLYYEMLQTSPDAERMRRFTRELFGEEWTLETLGF